MIVKLYVPLFLSLALASQVIAQSYFCTCNLKPAACDTNCCCDPDCSAQMKEFFSGCTSTFNDPNAKACTQTEVVNVNFSPRNTTVTSSDLFCVIFDRYTSRNFYMNPTVNPSDATSVNTAIAANAPQFEFGVAGSRINNSAQGTQYVAGSLVETVTESATSSYLIQPAPVGQSAACSDASPLTFLTAASFACTRSITSTTCSTAAGISLSDFVSGFRVASRPGLFAEGTRPDYNNPNLLNLTATSVQCFNASGVAIACPGALPAPTLVGSVCQNVLVKLTYSLSVTAAGIQSITYSAELRNIDLTAAVAMQQNFTSTFSLNGRSSSTSRSGNPGYIAEWPLRAAVISNSSSASNSSSNSTLQLVQLSLPAASVSGDCDASSAAQQQVRFGVNAAATCRWQLQYNSSSNSIINCQQVNARSRQLLQLISHNAAGQAYIGTLGNSTENALDDWTRLQNQSCQDTVATFSAGKCLNMLTSAQLRISFARIGSFSNSINKVIGATLQCFSGDVNYQCTGSCSRTTQNFLTKFSVTFVDESGSVADAVKLRPVYFARLPQDFFYPLF